MYNLVNLTLFSKLFSNQIANEIVFKTEPTNVTLFYANVNITEKDQP